MNCAAANRFAPLTGVERIAAFGLRPNFERDGQRLGQFGAEGRKIGQAALLQLQLNLADRAVALAGAYPAPVDRDFDFARAEVEVKGYPFHYHPKDWPNGGGIVFQQVGYRGVFGRREIWAVSDDFLLPFVPCEHTPRSAALPLDCLEAHPARFPSPQRNAMPA